MITKAIIEEIIDKKTYKVVVPIIEKTANSMSKKNVSSTATICSQLNSPMNLKIGDTVFVDFEENNYLKPVILGSLNTGDIANSKPSLTVNSLEVENNAKFSSDTSIGNDIDYNNIVCLKNTKKNIQDQINNLSNELTSIKTEINKKMKDVEDFDGDIGALDIFTENMDVTIAAFNEKIGNTTDSRNKDTIFGTLNGFSEDIDKILKSVGTIDESTTFFAIIEDLRTRLIKLKNSSPVVNPTEESQEDVEPIEPESESDSDGNYTPSQSAKFDDLIKALRSKFPNGKYWNHMPHKGTGKEYNNQDGWTNTPCTKHNSYCGTSNQTCNGYAPNGHETSWQCMGYANKCGFDMTGYDPEKSDKWNTTTDKDYLKKLKKGDIIRYKNDGHSIYVTDVSGSTITYTDCNSDGHCVIRWDAKIKKETIKSTFTYIRISPSNFKNSRLLAPEYKDVGVD